MKQFFQIKIPARPVEGKIRSVASNVMIERTCLVPEGSSLLNELIQSSPSGIPALSFLFVEIVPRSSFQAPSMAPFQPQTNVHASAVTVSAQGSIESHALLLLCPDT